MTLDARKLVVGTKLILKDGSIVEVAENPKDGIWLFCNYLSSPSGENVGAKDQPVFSDDVQGLA